MVKRRAGKTTAGTLTLRASWTGWLEAARNLFQTHELFKTLGKARRKRLAQSRRAEGARSSLEEIPACVKPLLAQYGE